MTTARLAEIFSRLASHSALACRDNNSKNGHEKLEITGNPCRVELSELCHGRLRCLCE